MMITKFNAATGANLGSFSCQQHEVQTMPQAPGEVLVEGHWPSDRYWLEDGWPAPRPHLVMPGKTAIVADDADCVEMSGIPAGTMLHVCNMSVGRADPGRDVLSASIEDGCLQWSTAVPGRFQLTLLPPYPWQALQLDVVADAVS